MFDAKVTAETTIEVPVEQVFDFLTTPGNIPLVLPGLIETWDYPELPLRSGAQFRYRYQLLGVVLEGDWVVTAMERPGLYEARTTGGSSEWRYRLGQRDGETHVALTVEYEMPRTVLERARAAIVERFNQHEADAYMRNLKTMLELREA